MKKYLLALALTFVAFTVAATEKKIVFIAGPPSHGPGQHEHRAGCLLLQSCLDQMRSVTPIVHYSPRMAEFFASLGQPPGITSVVYSNGWPTDAKAFDGAATIVVYSDGGGGHPLLQDDHLKTMGALMDKGVGLVCLHYAVEPTIEKGEKEFLDWLGGAFEINWSVNPDWAADFKSLPNHPITRGVQPFKTEDEWYFHMRFRDGMRGVTPILTAIPGPSTTKRNDGPHEGNPAVRELVERGEPQCVAWAAERVGGGRGFGLTGGHFHRKWGDENFRKLVLNAILWTARVQVPENGVASMLKPNQLNENLDTKPVRR